MKFLKWLWSESVFNKIYYTATPIIATVLMGFFVNDIINKNWAEAAKDIVIASLGLGIMLMAKRLDLNRNENTEDDDLD